RPPATCRPRRRRPTAPARRRRSAATPGTPTPPAAGGRSRRVWPAARRPARPGGRPGRRGRRRGALVCLMGGRACIGLSPSPEAGASPPPSPPLCRAIQSPRPAPPQKGLPVSDAASPRHLIIPLWIKLAYTAFMAVLIPVYLKNYGPTNFLYFCDVAAL